MRAFFLFTLALARLPSSTRVASSHPAPNPAHSHLHTNLFATIHQNALGDISTSICLPPFNRTHRVASPSQSACHHSPERIGWHLHRALHHRHHHHHLPRAPRLAPPPAGPPAPHHPRSPARPPACPPLNLFIPRRKSSRRSCLGGREGPSASHFRATRMFADGPRSCFIL
jgi:hypothetical protein